jgi:glutamate transport system permease protein
VLFDEPGPRARRRIRLFNVFGAIAIVAFVVWILYRFANPPQGENQLSWDLWKPALSADAWIYFYLPGLLATLEASVLAIVGSMVFGVVFGIGRLLPVRIVRWISSAVVEFCRAVPVLLFMIFFWRLFAGMGFNDGAAFWAVVLSLVLYNGSVVAELVRSGVGNLPRGQHEAAIALGMSPLRSLVSVEVPQALIAMLPAMITQLVVVLKDTALGSIITYTDLLQESRRLGSAHFDTLQTLCVSAVIYFIICYILSIVAERLPERLKRHTIGVVREPVQAPIAILDPSNVLAQERASERELPQGGAEPLFPDHYHGSNAVVTDAWRYAHMEHGHDPRHPDEHLKTILPESVYRKRSQAEDKAVRSVWGDSDDEDAGDTGDASAKDEKK